MKTPAVFFLAHRHSRRALAWLGAATLCLGLPSLHADDWSPNLTLTSVWQDNATNANLSSDRLGALQTQAELLATQRYPLNRDDSAQFGLHAAADWWPRFKALNTGTVGLRAEWQHKFGLGALAPIVALELAGDYVAAGESGRRGAATSIALSLRKRFNDQWRATVTQDFSNHNARYAVYDRNGAQSTLELGYDYSQFARFTVAGFWRSGDVISYATPPRPELVAIANHRMTVDTFGEPRVAYSVDARTFGGKIGAIRALDESSALLLSYEYRSTQSSPLRYRNQLVSLALVHQF